MMDRIHSRIIDSDAIQAASMTTRRAAASYSQNDFRQYGFESIPQSRLTVADEQRPAMREPDNIWIG